MADKIPYGRLKSCSWDCWSSGMMMYSHESSSMELAMAGSGEWQMTDREQSDREGETVRIYRVDPSAVQKIEALIEKNSMPAWSDLKEDTDPRFQPTDVSSGSTIVLVFDRKELGGAPLARYSISAKAARQHGHTEEVNEFIDMLGGLRRDKMLLSETRKRPGFKIGNLFDGKTSGGNAPGGTGDDAASGENVCPECGFKGVEGKFCPECGTRMPGR